MKLVRTSQFRKDYKRAGKQKRNLDLLKDVIEKLVNREKLPSKHRDHRLTGALRRYRELHIESDWLLIYQLNKNDLTLLRLGSHSELFEA